MPEPAVRATWSQRLLRSISGLPEPTRERALRDVPVAVLEAIASAGRLEWIPIEHHVALLDGAHDALGDRYVEFYRRMVVDNLKDGMLSSLVSGGIRLFGIGPDTLVKVLPRAFATMARGCGELRFERLAANAGTLVELRGLPPALRQRDTYGLTIQAVLEACYAIGRRTGSCELDTTSLRAGVLRYHMKMD